MISGGVARSAGRPKHRPATKNMHVNVPDRLASVRAGVEDDPVAVGGDALGDRHLAGVANQVCQQPGVGRRELGHVRVMLARDDKHVYWRLRIDITECQCARISRDYGRGYLSGSNAAEQAVRHGADLNVWRVRDALDI